MATPLSQALRLAVSADIADEDFPELLSKPNYAGKTVRTLR
jgi:hypothetical protein